MQQRNTGSIAARLAPALVVSLLAATGASAATLSVGPGKQYAAPCAAFNAARDGDTIEISGNNIYKGDVCGISRNNLTIRGVNGRPMIDANGANAMGKAIWVVGGNNITIENVEMYGARVPDQNGAALRLEGTGFTLRQSFLHDNENGILSGANTASDILIEYSEFGHNGFGDGYSHNLYIGNVRSLTFRYSYSHDANVGHNLKSRAQVNTIYNNRFSSTAPGQTSSTAAGSPSYEVDLPNAGTSYVIGNVIEQPAANSNPNILAYGEEGASNPGKDLYVVNNTFLNDAGSGTFVMIGSGVSTPALIQNNVFAGAGSVTSQGNATLRTNHSAAAPAFVNRATYDLHPAAGSPMINAASAPGTAPTGFVLAPIAQYQHVASGEARINVNDIGAYASNGAAATPPATTGWTQCANEGGTCTFSGTREVRYGSGTTFVSRTVSGSVACSNAVFGDPTPNVAKTCSYAATAWTQCANEGGTCSFSGTHEVRYGSGTTFVSRTVTGSVACSNAVFGDPTPNVAKTCSYAADSSTAPAAETWNTCAGEGALCTFSGTRDVRYGAGSSFVTRTFTGSVLCSNAVFGDPALGVVKSCSVSSLTK
ncbi:hypothetical protein [Herbaspirillum sp. SJZ107]|uniref:hypothetical protein n=1 Tax=Herbaspirillum sp. SJZ107 TaxID=2572881 RepID=UPI00116CB037|nr:hypothetical protein [Herbaspirillum sp. SJZ107]TQK05266.1 hypothetical protein FBX97_4238 [Herbaspirillum sp. SJZ107]